MLVSVAVVVFQVWCVILLLYVELIRMYLARLLWITVYIIWEICYRAACLGEMVCFSARSMPGGARNVQV